VDQGCGGGAAGGGRHGALRGSRHRGGRGSGSGLSPTVQNGASAQGHDIFNLYILISVFAVFIFLLVEGLLLWIILKYRRSHQPAGYRPPEWHGNTKLEVAWTLGPFLILAVIGYFSFVTLQKDFVRPADSVTDMQIEISAHQYGWIYTYPNGAKVDSEGLDAAQNPMVVPTGKMVRLMIDTTDVIHSWWVPGLTGKTDAVPGYSNYTWLKIDRPGTWRGQCAELCGVGHATMLTYVKAAPPAEFQAWLNRQKAGQVQTSPSPTR
jgi:cytochrome c oxidase subunit II